ncbi:MAG: ribosome biogenesis protein [Candidatus Aenigmarchaeota archaeon]|nr:ribosome biogenesis protein [Candidatus Aenigmarchaeota archaeon]
MLRKCPVCRKYSLREMCCTGTENPHPPKFSLADKYGKYRRATKGL